MLFLSGMGLMGDGQLAISTVDTPEPEGTRKSLVRVGSNKSGFLTA